MSFRLDDVRRTGALQWTVDLQGLYGSPYFGSLHTDDRGRGLFVHALFHEELAWLRTKGWAATPTVLAQGAFRLDPFESRWDAALRIALALQCAGWGTGQLALSDLEGQHLAGSHRSTMAGLAG